MNIIETTKSDTDDVLEVYALAFPEEDLRTLVAQLMSKTTDVLSLVARIDGEIAGHVAFTTFDIRGNKTPNDGALLSPLCVHPNHQRSGVGTKLVNHAIEQLILNGTSHFFVLGDPRYYSRFGFETERRLLPPYDIPAKWADAWQSRSAPGAPEIAAGRCDLPKIWLEKALWLP